MSKNSDNNGNSGSRGSNPGTSRGRSSTGFPGGNYPSTTGSPSGKGRGNAPARGSK